MKRAGAPESVPDIFSDSDSDTAQLPPLKRRAHPVVVAKPPPASAHIPPDSLDQFMTALSTHPPVEIAPTHHHPFHEDDDDEGHNANANGSFAIPKSESNEQQQQQQQQQQQRPRSPVLSSSHAKDLVLAPVDYSAVTLPPIVRLPPYSPSAQCESEHARTLIDLCATYTPTAPQLNPLFHFSDLPPTLPYLTQHLNSQYPTPTPVQSLTIPAVFNARNVIAIATTGSGKTLAYAIPLLIHAALQPGNSRNGRGPVALVLAPARELAVQIADVLTSLSAKVCLVVGGRPKYQQYKELRDSGAVVVVATPGRFIDMLKMKACTLKRCSMLVLDEADRMLDMGFEHQIMGIMGVLRPDAQRLLFSATWHGVREVAERIVKPAVKIVITDGRKANAVDEGMVSEAVSETYLWMDSKQHAEAWLRMNMRELIMTGCVILFCSSRGEAAEMANFLRKCAISTACVHGEVQNEDREGWLDMFRAGEIPVLVTTDVSARGLDVDHVGTVVNWRCAKNWQWHVHRVGRTGRAGKRGKAITLVTEGDANFMREARRMYAKCGREVHGLSEVVRRMQEYGVLNGGRGATEKRRRRGRR